MENKLYILLRKFFQKQAGWEDIVQLKKLFSQGEAEEQLSGFYEEAWEQADFSPEKETEERIWAKLQKQIHTAESMPVSIQLPLWKRILRIAASLLIPLLCAGLGYYYARNTSAQDSDKMTVSVEIGQKARVQLPDGTSVWLNSAGSLTCDKAGNRKERVVYLQGEAYFEVAKDEVRPFIVKMNDNISVEALGTSFNIKAYPDDNYIVTTLIEGSLRVSSPGQSELLKPNEKLAISRSSGQFAKSTLPDSYDAQKTVLWISNQLAFEQERLEDIAKMLERIYNVRIRFASDKLKNICFSGVIKNNNLENVLQVIEFVSPVRHSREDMEITIRDK